MLHKDYLLKHKKVLFATLLAKGKLYQHCAEIENQAQQIFDSLVEQMKENEGVTEQLKEKNKIKWICRMQSIGAKAHKITRRELIYVWC
ncbi:MAG: TnpV protein [Clostridia bacterium]|nr:TnpV protein [Clostridia bacterium]